MHPSTVAAILAFTAGMATAAPALGPDLILSNTQPTKLRTSLGKARVDSNLDEFLDDDSSALPVAKRNPQNVGKGRNGEPVYFFNDVLTVSQKESVEKRDPQRRGRLSRIGEAIDVGSGAIGLVSDGINLGKTIKGQPAQPAQQAQPAKRDPRSKFHNIGNAIEAGAGAIGFGADIISIGGAAQPAQHAKRDPQRRGRLGRLGDAFEGAAGAIGFGADIIGATQPQPAQPAQPAKRDAQRGNFKSDAPVACLAVICTEFRKDDPCCPSFEKRDPQRRGRLGRVGNAAEIGAGAIGFGADIISIGGAVQGQPAQPAKRDPRSKFRNIGNAIEAGAGAIGVGADIISIGGAVQGQPAQHAKRDPQRRGRLGRLGDAFEGAAGAIGFGADIIGATQPQPAQPAKRDAQRGRFGFGDSVACLAVVCTEFRKNDPCCPSVEKRDPQRRGRLGRLGDAFEGAAGAIGFGADIIGATQPQPAQPAKRDPRSKFRNIGNALEGAAGAIGLVGDVSTIAGATQPQPAKRDPQRGRQSSEIVQCVADVMCINGPGEPYNPCCSGSVTKRDPRSKFRNIGNVLEGAAGAIGLVGDVSTIAGAAQPQPAKRDPQRGRQSPDIIECAATVVCANAPGKPYSPCCIGGPFTKRDPRSKFRNIGNVFEGAAGLIGFAGDASTIAGAAQGQPAKRDSQHDDALIIGGAPAVHSGRPIDGNTLAKLSRGHQAEKRELEQGEADIADDTFEDMEQEEQEE